MRALIALFFTQLWAPIPIFPSNRFKEWGSMISINLRWCLSKSHTETHLFVCPMLTQPVTIFSIYFNHWVTPWHLGTAFFQIFEDISLLHMKVKIAVKLFKLLKPYGPILRTGFLCLRATKQLMRRHLTLNHLFTWNASHIFHRHRSDDSYRRPWSHLAVLITDILD